MYINISNALSIIYFQQCQEDESGYRSVNFRKYQLVGYSSIMAFGTAIIYENNSTGEKNCGVPRPSQFVFYSDGPSILCIT